MHSERKSANFLEPLVLRRIRPDHNERRFYVLVMTADLFGDVVLMRQWGRIGTGGKQRLDRHNNLASAADSFERLARSKRRRGYVDYISFAGSEGASVKP